MKWCFLINNFNVLPEFFGKLADQVLKEGDTCLVVFGSKIAEYEKKKFFPAGTNFISMVDWCVDHYQTRIGCTGKLAVQITKSSAASGSC